MTAAAEQAFLRALSASANVRLSAAAAGFAHSSFYARKRKRRPFAREMRLALKMGWDRLELALLEAGLADSHADDQWRHNDPPPVPPMSADQALQLLHLHNKTVNLGWDEPHRRKRRGETQAVYVERLRAMWSSEKAREAEDAALARAARYQRSGDWRLEDEPPPPDLPPLHLVTGWSKAKPASRRTIPSWLCSADGGSGIGRRGEEVSALNARRAAPCDAIAGRYWPIAVRNLLKLKVEKSRRQPDAPSCLLRTRLI